MICCEDIFFNLKKIKDKLRTFVAIDLHPEIKKSLSHLIDELKMLRSQNIKWISLQGMHLTLKFLGEIRGEMTSEIENVLNRISKKYCNFTLKFKGTGFFPPGRRNPRILWIGIEENNLLNDIQSELEKEMEKLGFPREQRSFHPHLTLGRVKSPYHLGPVLSLLEQYREKEFGEMIVKKITFFKSTLKPTGAEYSVLSEFMFK